MSFRNKWYGKIILFIVIFLISYISMNLIKIELYGLSPLSLFGFQIQDLSPLSLYMFWSPFYEISIIISLIGIYLLSKK
jgi:hypothetical protein